MNLALSAVAVILALLLLLNILGVRKLWRLSRGEMDMAPVLNELSVIKQGQLQVDRSVRDEISHNRSEQQSQLQALRAEIMGTLKNGSDSQSITIEALTRSTEQKLDLLRSAMDRRLEAFGADSGRKIDALSQSVTASSDKVQGKVSTDLIDFRRTIEESTRNTGQLQREQTEKVSRSIQTLLSTIDDKQVQLQAVIDSKLMSMGQNTDQKLADVAAALRSQSQQLGDETGRTFKALGDSVLSTLTSMSQIQRNELLDLKSTIDGRLRDHAG
jgi:hypothetical protein